MTPDDYEFLAEFLLKSSGLNLGPGKAYLLESRLIPLANSLGLIGIADLVKELQRAPHATLRTAITEAMTTNETLFFRDKKPFEDLTDSILPELMKSKQHERKLRIWCAACSSGQEPYSIAIAISEKFPELARSWSLEILGTDLNEQVLDKARAGIYTQFEVQRGLPIQYLMKYFEKRDNGWQIKETLRKQVSWKRHNLLEPCRQLGLFDLIFCRNVLIYFDAATKKLILDRLAQQLDPAGYLILGGAETVLGLSEAFSRAENLRASVYQKTGATRPPAAPSFNPTMPSKVFT